MNKLLPSLALVLVAGLAAPAMAAPYVPGDADANGFNASLVLNQLQDMGVKAIDVADGWNGKVRATVVLDDGSQVFQYFTEDSLQPIGQTSGNTRVLSKLDVTRGAFETSVNSIADINHD